MELARRRSLAELREECARTKATAVDGEISGYGPMVASAVRDLIDRDAPFLAAVATDGERVSGVATLRRRPSARQVAALEWLYPTCAAEGCASVAFLEVDHRVPWAASSLTPLELMDRLCPHHHDLETLEGWGLVEGRGKPAFVSPDDPRHPRHAHSPTVRLSLPGCTHPTHRAGDRRSSGTSPNTRLPASGSGAHPPSGQQPRELNGRHASRCVHRGRAATANAQRVAMSGIGGLRLSPRVTRPLFRRRRRSHWS